MSPQCPQLDIETVKLATRLRNTKTYIPAKTDSDHIIFDTPMAETPRSIHNCIAGHGSEQAVIAMRIGAITATQASDIVQKGTHRRIITTLASKIERVCLEESHRVWLRRNDTPDIENIIQDATVWGRKQLKRKAAVLIDTEDTEHNKTMEWEDTRNRVLGRLEAWKRWGTNDTHKVNMAQLKQYTQMKTQTTTRKRPPSDTHTDAAPAKKRGRGNTATHTPTQLTHTPQPLVGLFQTPTAAEKALVNEILGKMHHATALQSLRMHKHINSAALDEAYCDYTCPYTLQPCYAQTHSS